MLAEPERLESAGGDSFIKVNRGKLEMYDVNIGIYFGYVTIDVTSFLIDDGINFLIIVFFFSFSFSFFIQSLSFGRCTTD